MSDDEAPTSNIFGLTAEQVERLDMTRPVTRDELLRALLAVHEAIFAQSQLVGLSAGFHVQIPREMITSSMQDAGKALDVAIEMMKDWGTAKDA